MQLYNRILLSGSIVIIIIIQLLFLYYIKYQIRSIPLDDFNLDIIGNALNLIINLVLITGVIVYSFQKRKSDKSKTAFLFSFTLIMIALLAFASFLTQVDLPFDNNYLFGQPLNKVIVVGCFVIYQFFQFVFSSILWLKIFDRKELLVSRAIMNSLIVVVLLFLFAFYFTTITADNQDSFKDLNSKNNIGVVLGAAVWSQNLPSPSLKARIDKAVELYRKKIINKIQLTGSNAPGELSEAAVAYNYLITLITNKSDIWVEDNTTSTNQQINFIKKNLVNREEIGNIIVISDAYHLARVREISRFYNISAYLASSDLKLKFVNKLQNGLRESVAILTFWLFAI